ncbi:MAG: peptidylprolyl isomerase [Asticcacaulis sp.]|uniref:peptidylprolyl isomerase n=1 Tax=Asticcacaulis sp. TaxID=1872648 RepID=UPI0039E29D8B
MTRRLFLILTAGALLAGCSKPADPPKPAATPAPKYLPDTGLDVPPDTVRVAIETSEGEIVLELDGKHAPQTTANFLHYVDTQKLDNGTFYRAIRAGDAGFIQFNSGDRTYPPIPHEPTSQTGLSHTDGAVSTARYAVGTASNEFTICIGDMTYLDAGGTATPDKQGYAVFGHVVSGMDVVKHILDSHIRDQAIVKPVIITSAHRIS